MKCESESFMIMAENVRKLAREFQNSAKFQKKQWPFSAIIQKDSVQEYSVMIPNIQLEFRKIQPSS